MSSPGSKTDDVARASKAIMAELAKVIVGQDDIVRGLVASLFANGHCLLIGVPGLAKTLLVQSIARVLGVDFKRIQFTPDLMPSDILGSEVIHEHHGKMEFQFRPGPVFTNLLLADEINRTPPKTQSALLEAMQERRVTTAGEVRPLPNPFLVVATQNPIEHEGTYPLPEAQLDRFMFSLDLGYPSRTEEIDIVRRTTIGETADLTTVISGHDIIAIQKLVRAMPVADHVLAYAVDLTASTRPNTGKKTADTYIEWGAGPRASQYLILGAKAFALMEGRAAPEAFDVRKAAPMVLGHRIVPNYRATGEGLKAGDLVRTLIGETKEPTY
ncbi:AAA family ATPase [Luteolibacter flavescens]|uniref:AAA family ATPase n=1 Tax=Luteolibacter flavescens TaxID=1859460 RepID=A0ABT3FKL9_9BACT|nr:AAA family ATPase [Luteolibacter flavescens]MCW1884124.1 AAA family ATPase [Luteolibacter flavescens]